MTLRVAIAYSFHDRDWLGGRNYFASLFRAIEAVAPETVKLVFVTGERTETTLPDEFPFLDVLRTPLMDRMHLSWMLRQFDLRLLNTDRLLARFMREHNIDVLSHSGQLGPNPGLTTIAWLYDFQFLHLPDSWNVAQIRWVKQLYRAACRNCDGIIVSSEHAMSDLDSFAPWCKAVKHILHFVSNPVDFTKLPSKRHLGEKYSLPSDYFYLPNQFWAHKNHKQAIDALVELKRAGVHTTIVCSGKTHDARKPGYFDELMIYCAASGVADRFKVLGEVPYEDTQGLMAHARAVINASRFEGWSTTVEEAKTLHKAILLSDIPVHLEQSPKLAHFFPLGDPTALARLMQQCLREEAGNVSRAAITADYAIRLKQVGNAYLQILKTTIRS
jgi:glycosyltransferase involved in cell wall biosynthesis